MRASRRAPRPARLARLTLPPLPRPQALREGSAIVRKFDRDHDNQLSVKVRKFLGAERRTLPPWPTQEQGLKPDSWMWK